MYLKFKKAVVAIILFVVLLYLFSIVFDTFYLIYISDDILKNNREGYCEDSGRWMDINTRFYCHSEEFKKKDSGIFKTEISFLTLLGGGFSDTWDLNDDYKIDYQEMIIWPLLGLNNKYFIAKFEEPPLAHKDKDNLFQSRFILMNKKELDFIKWGANNGIEYDWEKDKYDFSILFLLIFVFAVLTFNIWCLYYIFLKKSAAAKKGDLSD
jgi:hypothetical protein